MQFFALFIIILLLGRALCKSCSNLDRFVERKSTFCVTLLLSLRKFASIKSPHSTFQNFVAFNPPTRNRIDQPMIATSTSAPAIRQRVADRASFVVDGFKPNQVLSVFQKLQIESDKELERFENFFKSPSTEILKQTDRQSQGRRLENFLMYSNVGLMISLVADVYLLFLIFSPMASQQGFSHIPFQICFLMALGAVDYPFRYFASVNQSATSLRDSIRHFRASSLEWSYWSKDFKVGPELFSSAYAHPSQLNEIIHHENKLEEIAGLLSLTLLLENFSAQTQRIKISVDVLMWRSEKQVLAAIVLRSNATLQTVRDAPATSESLLPS